MVEADSVEQAVGVGFDLGIFAAVGCKTPAPDSKIWRREKLLLIHPQRW
jgi:hypothetical protein